MGKERIIPQSPIWGKVYPTEPSMGKGKDYPTKTLWGKVYPTEPSRDTDNSF